MIVEYEIPHLRAAEKALALMRGLDQLEETVFMGAGSADRTLGIEFLQELVNRMKAGMDPTESRRVDFPPRLEVVR